MRCLYKSSYLATVLLFQLIPCNVAFNLSNNLKVLRRTSKFEQNAVSIPVQNDSRAAFDVKVNEERDGWIKALDYDAFAKEVSDLGKKLTKESSEDDVKHLEKILNWRDMAAAIGIATMWMSPNPISILALSTWTYASWTMVAHHTCHGGYNRVDAGKYNSRGFALGTVPKRVVDWCDWMLPEAWNIEHNRLHHYHLGEPLDPDLVERNLEFLRKMNVPMSAKYAIVFVLMPVWKWFYYAPNTFKELQIAKFKSENREIPANAKPEEAVTLRTLLVPLSNEEKAMQELVPPITFFSKVLAPFLLTRFVLLPSPLLLIPGVGTALFVNAVTNLIFAEMLTNIHGFITIVTNHAGEDLYKFDDEVRPKSGSFYVRQIVSSTNYATGTDLIDFCHGWLNYQIEHHVWPDLSMLQYQRGAPQLKAICEKHGVPYVQENVFERLKKTVDIMVGKTTMIEFPTSYEPQKDKATRGVTWKTTNGAIDDD
jgi:fatty acid desaturase